MQLFNAEWSLYTFFQTSIADVYALPLVVNTPASPTDEELMRTEDHWLRISLVPGKYQDIQTYTVSCNLACTHAFAPTTTWLRVMSANIQDVCLQYSNEATHNLIPIYDYDAMFSEADITAYLASGTLPDGYDTILATDPSSLSLYTPDGQHTGFIAQQITRDVDYIDHQDPLLAFWSQAFQFFDPLQLRGSRG